MAVNTTVSNDAPPSVKVSVSVPVDVEDVKSSVPCKSRVCAATPVNACDENGSATVPVVVTPVALVWLNWKLPLSAMPASVPTRLSQLVRLISAASAPRAPERIADPAA